jgi:hypothetical protein
MARPASQPFQNQPLCSLIAQICNTILRPTMKLRKQYVITPNEQNTRSLNRAQ